MGITMSARITIDLPTFVAVMAERGFLNLLGDLTTVVLQKNDTTRVMVGGKVVKETSNPVEAINYATANTPPYGIIYIPNIVIPGSKWDEIKFYKKQRIIIGRLYFDALPDTGGDIMSNYYTEAFEDGVIIGTIESNKQGNFLAISLREANYAYVDLRIINVSESGAYIVHASNSVIKIRTYSTGYAAIAGMEGVTIEGGSNNLVEVHIYDAYRDGLAVYWSHDNYIYGKIRQTGRHGALLNGAHNNFLILYLEDIRSRAGQFGDPDGCGLIITDGNNNSGIITLANPFYTPWKDIYIPSGTGNVFQILRRASGVIDVAPNNTVIG